MPEGICHSDKPATNRQQVERVAEGRYGVGTHAVVFNGSSLPAGLYIYRLEMPDGRLLTGKIVHLE